MLYLRIREVLSARGVIEFHKALIDIGIPRASVNRMLNNGPQSINLLHIEKICLHYNCTPNDLIYWVPDESQKAYDRPEIQLYLLKNNHLPDLLTSAKMLPLQFLPMAQGFLNELMKVNLHANGKEKKD